MGNDERADRLAEIAVELVVRVRDDEPTAVHRWLNAVVADNDMMALAVILAAAVPDDRTWTELTAWIAGPAPMETASERRRRQWRDSQRRKRARPQAVQDVVHRPSTTSSTGDVADTDRQDAA